MTIGVAAPLIAAFVGISLGTASAFFGGWTESVVTRVTDMMMSFDPLLLGVLIVAVLGPGVQNLSIAIAAALVPPFIRLSRASTLAVRREAYVDASIAMGRGSFSTIGLHILPNISGPLIVMLTIWIGSAIRLEASLSFIGLGAQAPAPSWGNMVREGVSDLFGSPLPALFAGLAITLAVLAFNVLGDALRDRLDPDPGHVAMTPILSIRNLQVSFASKGGEVHALRGVDLDIAPGECLGVVEESDRARV